MSQTIEQILVVYSVAGTPLEHIQEACDAISSYVHRLSAVTSVVARPLVFRIPAGTAAGATLNSELTEQLQNSVGAVVFVDDLRPNIAYELGYFHGRGRRVLLVTDRPVEETWLSISDLAGSPLLVLSRETVVEGVHAYLDRLYADLAALPPFGAPALPRAERNMLGAIASHARIGVQLYASDFGPCMTVDTWGGVIFDTGYNLLRGAGFKLVLRAPRIGATYSVYFRLRFITAAGVRSTINVGLSSKQSRLGLESNERNLPGQSLTREWRMLSGTFADVLARGHVLGVERVEHLDLIRVRAGPYQVDPFAKTKPYEIGYLEVLGVDG